MGTYECNGAGVVNSVCICNRGDNMELVNGCEVCGENVVAFKRADDIYVCDKCNKKYPIKECPCMYGLCDNKDCRCRDEN